MNTYTEGDEADDPSAAPRILYIDPRVEAEQLERLARVKSTRDAAAVQSVLARLAREASDPTVNLVPTMIEAAKKRATLGEMVHSLESVFGVWTEKAAV